ncbi:MAG: M48 family metalloprotease [Rickettsiales bacterium]|nr:M48 family metalloprotease [Rickettsiales bacterium]
MFINIFFASDVFSIPRKDLENTIIIDTEIANFLDDVVGVVSDKTNMKMYVVVNNSFNAVATSKNTIGIYTGLFYRIDDIEVFVAVITHEIGHIVENHLTRLQKRIDDAQDLSILGNIVAIGAIIAATNVSSMRQTPDNPSGYALPSVAPLLLNDVLTKDLTTYTRSEESLADQFLINTFLEKKISLTEYMNFMSEMAKEDDSLYAQNSSDHPKTSDRVADIKSRLENNEDIGKKLPIELSVKYKMVQAKIFGLLNNIEDITAKYSSKNMLDTPYYFYALSVSNWFNKNHDTALDNINKIIDDYLLRRDEPYANIINVGYLWEVKAEIYLSKGDIKNAIDFYELAITELESLAVENNKNFDITKQSFASVLIKSDDKENINRGIEILQLQLLKKQSANIFYQLGIGYGKLNDIGRAHYYLAKYFSIIGNKKEVQNNIEKSEKVLDKDSPEYADLIMMKTL